MKKLFTIAFAFILCGTSLLSTAHAQVFGPAEYLGYQAGMGPTPYPQGAFQNVIPQHYQREQTLFAQGFAQQTYAPIALANPYGNYTQNIYFGNQFPGQYGAYKHPHHHHHQYQQYPATLPYYGHGHHRPMHPQFCGGTGHVANSRCAITTPISHHHHRDQDGSGRVVCMAIGCPRP